MRENGPVNDSNSFVMRIWLEAVNNNDRVKPWKGSIQNVRNGKRIYFTDLSSANRFIQEQTGICSQKLISSLNHLRAWVQHLWSEVISNEIRV